MEINTFLIVLFLGKLGSTLRLPSTEEMLQNFEQRLESRMSSIDDKIVNLEEQMKLENKQLRKDVSLIFKNLIDFEDKIQLLLLEQKNTDVQKTEKIGDKSNEDSTNNDRFTRMDTRINGLEAELKEGKQLKQELMSSIKTVSTAVSLMFDDIGEIRDVLKSVKQTVGVNEIRVAEFKEMLKSLNESTKNVENQCKINEDFERSICSKLENDFERIGSVLNDTMNTCVERPNILSTSAPTTPRTNEIRSCQDTGVSHSGIYTIKLNGTPGFRAYCDMETDGGGWLVLQRRKDGSVDFNRTWDEYKRGFGEVRGEFWLGNDFIHKLTSYSHQELRIDLWDWIDHKAYAKYDTFSIGPESDQYRLKISGYSGTAGDSMLTDTLNNQYFSTIDRDNDGSGRDCAKVKGGGWWFRDCTLSNLNGHFYQEGKISPNSLYWYDWPWSYHKRLSLKGSEIKIRPK